MAKIQYDFGSGRSDPSTFPVAALQAAATKVIAEQAQELTEYPGNLGHPGMRQAMALRETEREGVAVNPDHLLLTNGSMQGVTLSAEALQENHGDTVLVEEYSYPGTLSAYRNLKLDMVGIPLDEGGMRPDKVEEQLDRLNRDGRLPKFIYTISTYQNPTGFVMPETRRRQIIELGQHYKVPIIEDNCYADVHYDGPLEPAFYALDDDPNIIYLCSLSKILAPGLRLGYIYAKPPMLDRLLARRSDAGSNTLAAAITAEFYKDGIGAHAKVANPVLKEKRDLTLQGLEEELGDICVWSEPVGGLFIWVRLPEDVDRQNLMAMSREQGVAYLPGQSFHYQRHDVPYLRLAFGHLTPDQISAGLPILARCIKSCRGSNEGRNFDSLF
jgi:2-aminoadipate transaminase